MGASLELKRTVARFSGLPELQYNADKTHVKGPVTHPDEELVRRALDSVAHIKSNRGAAKVLDVSEATVRRWRAGDIALPLREPTKTALQRYFLRHNEAEDASSREGFESLLHSPTALYATLSDFGAPGENAEDKLALIELISLVAARMRRQGRRIPVDHLTEAHGKVIRGEL